MSSPFQARRAEEKLGLILGRIGSIRARLNSLAWQRAVFGGLGWILAPGALVMLAAYYLSPLAFLAVAAVLSLLIVAGSIGSMRAGWRMHVNAESAAQVADRRADLRGRLETIVEIGELNKVVRLGHAHEHPALWSYLIEDTLSRQDDFEPRRIERRRVSRSIFGFTASLVVAAIALILIGRVRGKPLAVPDDQADLTMNLNDLNLQPADPDSEGVEVQADQQTMRRLEERMAQQGLSGNGTSSSQVNKLMNHAKQFAGNLQDKLTGRKASHPKINLKLADAGDDLNSMGKRDHPNLNPSQQRPKGGAQFEHEESNDKDHPVPRGKLERNQKSQESAGPQSPQEHGSEQARTTSPGNDSSDKSSDQSSNDQGSGSGASHGIGADPDTLFGSASTPKLGSEGFEISIDARTMSHGAKGEGHAYLPPKVRTPLNPTQHPDEPIARAAVPEQDRAAVKRVFER
jgi:hypothetical protein